MSLTTLHAEAAFEAALSFHIKTVLRQIEIFAHCGEFEIRDVYLPNIDTIKRLRELGYHVKRGAMDPENVYVVDWIPEKK